MRPSLNILDDELTAGSSTRRCASWPRSAWRSAGRRCAGGCSTTACLSTTAANGCSSRATSWRRRSRPRRPRSCCTTVTASRTPTSAATGSTSSRARPASRSSTTGPARRAWRTRPTSSSTSASPTGSPTSRTSPRPSRPTTTSRPQVSDAWRLYMTLTNSKKPVVSGAFTEHGVPRMVEMMQLFRRRPGRPHRPADVDLHDHRDRQLPVQRGLLPEPHRLRRGGHRGRDRAGHADGPDRAGDDRRRHGLPHGRRPGRDHDGPDRPARRAGPVRRGAGDVPHEDRQLADVGHRGAPARRGVRRGRQVARPADAVVHGPVGRPDPRRPGRRGDVRQRAHRGARRGQLRVRARGCSTSCSCSACPSSSSTTRCAARRSASCARSSRSTTCRSAS